MESRTENTYRSRSCPPQYWGTFNDGPLDYPGTYVITTDQNGGAIDGAMDAPANQVVWHGKGITIVNAPGDFTVNGKAITNVKPWSRIVTVP